MCEEKCLICDEAITNPVCPDCLERQVCCWADERKPSLVPVLKGVGESVKEFDVDPPPSHKLTRIFGRGCPGDLAAAQIDLQNGSAI